MKALVKLLTISALIITATMHAPAADCESQPAAVFYQYIRELYYAKNITQVAKYWISTTRIPFINLKFYNTNAELVNKLPETQARRFRALVLEDRGATLLVGMADPSDLFAYDELARLLKREIDLAALAESQLLHCPHM